jgi:rod shape-determining protein MreC
MIDRAGQFFSSLILYTAISLVLLGIDRTNFFYWPRTTVERVINPITALMTRAISFTGQPAKMLKLSVTGTKQVADLERRLAEALATQAKITDLEAQNKALRKLLASDIPASWQVTPVRAIGSGSQIVLGVGKNQGVQVGTTIVDQQGALVGLVIKSSNHTSWVTPITHLDKPISVFISGTNTQGTVRGDNGKLVLEKVEQREAVSEGNLVLTTGADDIFPQGLIIGQVGSLLISPAEIYKSAVIDPVAGLTDQILFVVLETQ